MMCWFYADSSQQNGANSWLKPALICDSGGWCGIHIDGTNVVFYNYDTTEDTITTAYTHSVWTHVAWMHSAGTTLAAYKDGVSVGSIGSGHTGSIASDLMLGANPNYGTAKYGGLLDDVRVYDGVVSAQEIAFIVGRTNSPGTWSAETALGALWPFHYEQSLNGQFHSMGI